MNKILFENHTFLYSRNGEKEVLLEGNTELITRLFRQHEVIGKGSKEEASATDYALIDMLTASYVLKCGRPVKVLEVGAVSGILSYHLISLLGKFNRGSHLCCVSDVIGNGSENQWLDRIVLAEEPAAFSYLTSDYDETLLQDKVFDVVILNGIVNFEEPYAVIKEGERLAKDGGIIICYCKDAPLLESSFKLDFAPDRRREYSLETGSSIITASK